MSIRPNPCWLAILLAAAWPGSGCRQTMDRLRPDPATPKTEAELAFETGADRPPTARTLYAMARILAGKGQDAQCRILLERIMTEHPDFMPAYCDMAELQMRNGWHEAAIRTLSAGLRRRATDTIIINNLGMCHLEDGDNAAALACFTQAAGLAPDNVRFRANMATALGLMGRYEESLALYKQILHPAEAHKNLGILCRARNDRVRAEEELNLAKALSAQWPDSER